MPRVANQDSLEVCVVENNQKKRSGMKTAQISCSSGRSGPRRLLKHSSGANEELKNKRSLPATVRSMMSALFAFFFGESRVHVMVLIASGLHCRSGVSQRSGEAAEKKGLQRKHACFRFCALPHCAQLSRVIVPRIPAWAGAMPFSFTWS